MKVFILKSGVFSIIVLSIYALVVSRYKPDLDIRNDYMAAIIDKHDRLTQAGNNRLLLVGGSNLAFGINSEEMQEKLGLNVVNLSLHAGLGGSFMLREAGSVVKSGDTVVVCLEYILYESGHEDVDLIEHTQFIYPEATAYYRFGLIESSLESYAHFKKVVDYCRYNPFRKNENGGGFGPVYNRQNFNRYGDIVARIGENDTPRNLKGGTKLGSIVLDASMVQAFHDIASRCKAVGARLYLTYPPYPKSWYLLNKSVIGGLESQIRKKLDFIPTISDPIAFVMDESCFYDTVNHLTTIGSDQRTAILIAELKTALPDRVASGNVTPSNTAALSSY